MGNSLALPNENLDIRDRANRAAMKHDCPPDARKAIHELVEELDRTPDLLWLVKRYKLSWNEQRILEHLANGKTPQEIAELDARNISTVRVHIRNIYRKTRVTSVVGLMALIIKGPVAVDYKD